MSNPTNLFDDYTFRCHALGYIMTDAAGESPYDKLQKVTADWKKALMESQSFTDPSSVGFEKIVLKANKLNAQRKELEGAVDIPHLSDTCKTYLSQIYTEVTTGRKKVVKNKFIEKGLELEEDAITQYCIKHHIFLEKNKERKNNGFIEGEIDIKEDDLVTDTKVSWDLFSFDRTVLKLNKMYKWQGKGYAILWDKPKAKISYNLLNTPERLILNEEKSLIYSWVGSEEEYKEACVQIRHNCIYDDLPPERKERSYIVALEDGDKEKIEKRVLECRKFLNNYESYSRQ